MATIVHNILHSYDRLPEAEQRKVAMEIIRRSLKFDLPPLTDDEFANFDETEDEIIADEARWDEQFAKTQDGLHKMANKVRNEIRKGNSMAMVFTNMKEN